ncbi:DUF6894 family protein [Mesorhizobium atlanticum]
MPHYFFDINANGDHTHDEVGLPFCSKIQLRKAAVATLPALALQDRDAGRRQPQLQHLRPQRTRASGVHRHADL